MVVDNQILLVNVPSIFIKHVTHLNYTDQQHVYLIGVWYALRHSLNNNMIQQRKLDGRHWLKVDM